MFSTLAWEIARYSTFRIELEGHTETTAGSGRETANKWELSTERANAARRSLVGSGVSAQQVWKVSGFADTQPLVNHPATSEANRRVTVVLRMPQGDKKTTDTVAATP